MLTTTLAFLAGIAVAAPPVGPLTMLFYRHAMVREFGAASALAVVIALADGLYAAVSTQGHHLLLSAPGGLVLALRIAGVVLLTALGLRYVFFTPVVGEAIEPARRGRVLSVAAQAAGIALLNPSAFLSWIVLVDIVRTTSGLTAELGPIERVALPLAVSAGVASWYTFVLLAWRSWVRSPSPAFARGVIRVVGVVLLLTATAYGWQASHAGASLLPAAAADVPDR